MAGTQARRRQGWVMEGHRNLHFLVIIDSVSENIDL